MAHSPSMRLLQWGSNLESPDDKFKIIDLKSSGIISPSHADQSQRILMHSKNLQIIITTCIMALFFSVGLTNQTPCVNVQTSKAQSVNASLKFDFGPGKLKPGYLQVLPTTTYSPEQGYGFEPISKVTCDDRGHKDALRSDFCTSVQ